MTRKSQPVHETGATPEGDQAPLVLTTRRPARTTPPHTRAKPLRIPPQAIHQILRTIQPADERDTGPRRENAQADVEGVFPERHEGKWRQGEKRPATERRASAVGDRHPNARRRRATFVR